MVEDAGIVVQAEQQGADDVLALVVAKAANHAVGAAITLDLLHAGAIAGAIGKVAPLGDDAVERAAEAVEPFPGACKLCGCGRQPDRHAGSHIAVDESLELLAPLEEWPLDERLAVR